MIRLINFFENDIIYVKNRGDIVDVVVIFFRDVLSGPLYIVIAVVNSILICSCIGYMGEQYLNKKKQKMMNNVNDSNVPSGNPINNVEAAVRPANVSYSANNVVSNIPQSGSDYVYSGDSVQNSNVR